MGKDEAGVVIIIFALLLPIIIGFVGLGVESSLWFSSRRQLQSAADAAAIAAAYEIRSGSGSSSILSNATTEATRNGYDSGNSDTLALNMPPTTGTYTASATAVEVLLTKPVALLFSKVFIDDDVVVNARAVATLKKSSEACVLALDPTANASMTNQGTANINLDGCSIAVNSSHSTAMSLAGASILTTDCISIVGNYSTGGGASLTTDCSEPLTGARAVDDPYESLGEPTIGGCDYTNHSVSSGTLTPGTYCSGINFSGNVALDPGVYVIDRGSFKVNAGAILTSNGGVTIFLTSSTGSQYASVTINGGATVDMEAQTSGDYSGVLFYGDRDAPAGINQTLNGGASMDLTGALYFPVGDIKYTGGATINGSCTQIIGYSITFNGNADMNNSCPGSGVSSIDVNNKVGLVE